MRFTRVFEKNGEKKCEHWSENEFNSFDDSAITSICAKGWDSLGFSKKVVRKNANIGQKMNSLLLAKMPSLRFLPRDGNHYDFRKNGEKKLQIGQKMNSVSYLYPLAKAFQRTRSLYVEGPIVAKETD